MNNPICSECNLLPTQHKCVVCKIKPVCPECCDKRGNDDLNNITCKECDENNKLINDAANGLTRLSDSTTITVREVNINEIFNPEAVEVQAEVVVEQNNTSTNEAPINNVINTSPSVDVSSLESVTPSNITPSTNTNDQTLATANDNNLTLASVVPPAIRQFSPVDESDLEDSFDSDDELGPFYDAVDEQIDIIEEEETAVPPVPEIVRESTLVVTETPSPAETNTALNETQVRSMTVAQLKVALGSNNLSRQGNKAVLQERLLPHLTSNNNATNNLTITQQTVTNVPAVNTTTPGWTILQPNETPVSFTPSRGMVDPSGNVQSAKFDFNETFVRIQNNLTSPRYERLGRTSQLKKDNEGNLLVVNETRNSGRAKMK